MTDASIPPSALPVTRAQAKAEKSPFYFPGSTCSNGHVSKRRTGSGYCYACETDPANLAKRAEDQRSKRTADLDAYNAARRDYRAKNAEKVREWTQNYKSKNREKLRLAALEYYRANIDERRAANRAGVRANPEANRARVKAWVKANPEKARVLRAMRTAREKGAPGKFTADDIAQLREWQAGNCAACQRDLNETGYHVDHIIPLARGGSNWQSNLQLLCPRCNSSKRASDYGEWLDEQRRAGLIP